MRFYIQRNKTKFSLSLERLKAESLNLLPEITLWTLEPEQIQKGIPPRKLQPQEILYNQQNSCSFSFCGDSNNVTLMCTSESELLNWINTTHVRDMQLLSLLWQPNAFGSQSEIRTSGGIPITLQSRSFDLLIGDCQIPRASIHAMCG